MPSLSAPLLPLLLLLLLSPLPLALARPFPQAYIACAYAIIHQTQKSIDFDNFSYMCDTFGPRWRGSEVSKREKSGNFSVEGEGTANLQNAINFVASRMKDQGLNVTLERVDNITNWQRNQDHLTLIQPRVQKLALLSLGSSVGGSVVADVFVVNSFADLDANADKVKGKIVLYNAPFTSYGKTVAYRWSGASRAAKYGAVGALVRSITPFSLYTPHTGSQHYDPAYPAIPVAAITVEDAEMMGRMFNRSQRVVVNLTLTCQTLPPTSSFNVIGQIDGCVSPQEVVVLGGHIDSWDVGQGAIDDGGGLFSAWEAVRILRELIDMGALPCPRRTIRAVLWVDEEMGQQGGQTYLRDHMAELNNTIIAMESDEGNFNPTGFGFSGPPEAQVYLKAIGDVLLAPFGAGNITGDGEDADDSPLCELGIPCASLSSADFSDPGFFGKSYFWYHHTNADSVIHMDREGLRKSVAAYAIVSYVLADMPNRLPTGYKPPTPPPAN